MESPGDYLYTYPPRKDGDVPHEWRLPGEAWTPGDSLCAGLYYAFKSAIRSAGRARSRMVRGGTIPTRGVSRPACAEGQAKAGGK